MLRGGEIIQQQQQADGQFRPVYMGDRDAWICERYTRQRPGAGDYLGTDPTLVVETYGARLNGPDGQRFSPLFLFSEADAQKQCDVLNGANGHG